MPCAANAAAAAAPARRDGGAGRRACRAWACGERCGSLFNPRHPEAALTALARFDLGDKLFARVDRLSGGERQRVGLARALLSPAQAVPGRRAAVRARPDAVAADAVDCCSRKPRTRNATLICSLHQVDIARAHFPRIVGLRDGRIVFDLPREQVTDAMIAALYQNEAMTGQAHDAGAARDPLTGELQTRFRRSDRPRARPTPALRRSVG